MPNATQNATNPVPCSPSPICVVVPRIAGTPIAPRDNIVFFLARLDGVAVPTVVAYALSYWISLELQVDISAKPMLRDFARYENGAWHLVDDFYLLESGMALSCLDGMRYANLIQDSAWHGGMDDPCEFEWIRDPSTFPSTVDRNIVPQEITAFLERCYNSAQRLGTQLFPYINCSMARFQQAAMHSRDTEVAPVTVPSSVASMTRGYGFMSRLPWHWVEYGENVSVLIDDQGQEVMEFDSDQMLVRNLPSGVPMRAFSDREALARRVASQRGLAVDGKLDTLMTERALGFNTQFYLERNNGFSMRWTGDGHKYVLRSGDDVALLGIDIDRMRIYLADGRFAECTGDPGGMFEIALYLTQMASDTIHVHDVTGMPVNSIYY